MTTQFKPTGAQLEAAENLFIARAFYETVKPAFENIQRQVLAEGSYRNSYFNHPSERMRTERNYEFIKDPKHDYMIEGIRENSPPDSDAGRYFSELDRRAKNAGFIYGMNADCRAENSLHDAQNALITAFVPITNLNVEDVSGNLDNRRQLIELTSQLMAKFVDTGGSSVKTKMKKYYSEHMNHIKPIVNEFLNSIQP